MCVAHYKDAPPLGGASYWGLCWVQQTILVAQQSYHPLKAGQRSFGEEALARGLVYLSLMHCLGSHLSEKHWYPVYTRKYLFPRKLSIDAVSPKT